MSACRRGGWQVATARGSGSLAALKKPSSRASSATTRSEFPWPAFQWRATTPTIEIDMPYLDGGCAELPEVAAEELAMRRYQ